MRDALRADDWPVGPGHFVADPLLRALLLHRLRFQDGDHPSYAVWQAVHVSLRGAYTPGGRHPSVPHLLHQKLVLGDAEACVGHLRLRFDEPDVSAWLALLHFIASAPYPRTRGSVGPDPRRAVALGRADNTVPRGSNHRPPSCTYCCAGCCTAYGCCPIRWPCRTKR